MKQFLLYGCSLLLALCSVQHVYSQTCTVSGYVEDLKTGERMIGAFITDSTGRKTAQTNNFGFFSLKFSKGLVRINASYVGYKTGNYTISVIRDTSLVIKLEPGNELQEVVIKSSMYNRNAATPLGMVVIPIKQLASVPALGEVDVLKAIQLQPGIQGGIEGSAGLFVRGGGAGENLYLIDDVPVYNVSHLYGFVSTFNSSAVKDLKVMKGCFPAAYGGRASSVIDVRTRDGNDQSFRGEVSVGMISSKLMFEGPLLNPKTTFIISARRSYLDLFTNLLKNTGLLNGSFPKYYFYDINAKVVHTFSLKDRIYLSFYNGKDHIRNVHEITEEQGETSRFSETNTETSGWGNLLGTLRWNHNSGSSLFINTTLAYSKYDYFTDRSYSSLYEDLVYGSEISRDYHAGYYSRIRDIIAKTDFNYSIGSKQTISFGAGSTFHMLSPGTNTYSLNDEALNVTRDTFFTNARIKAGDYYLYAEYKTGIGKATLEMGMRASGFIASGDHYFNPEPRLSLNYILLPNLALKAGYSRMEQYIHLLSTSGVSMPTDLWIPSTKGIRPLGSDQVNAGMAYQWQSITVTAEVYRKWLNNTTDFTNGASLTTDLRPWFEKTTQGEGSAKGFEISLEKSQGNVSGNISYTLAKANRKYPAINQGKEFPFSYDRRHNFNFFVNWIISPKYDVSAAWIYGTGYPATIPVEKYMPGLGIYNTDSEYGGEIDYYPSRNNVHMAAYHRLDLSFHYKVTTRIGEHTISVDIFNVYNRKNPIYMYYSGYRVKTLQYANLLPVIPSLTYTLKF
jgi:outer membrane cobalamin receptor